MTKLRYAFMLLVVILVVAASSMVGLFSLATMAALELIEQGAHSTFPVYQP